MANLNQSKDVVSYLGPNTSLEGDLHSNGNLHLDGRFSGTIICNGDLIIGETSTISGDIKAKNIFIAGTFKGTIEAVNSFEIAETGHVEGDLKGSRLVIKEGGVYKGKVNMDVIESESIYEGAFQVINK